MLLAILAFWPVPALAAALVVVPLVVRPHHCNATANILWHALWVARPTPIYFDAHASTARVNFSWPRKSGKANCAIAAHCSKPVMLRRYRNARVANSSAALVA
ncbi:hypothetical protein N9164_12590 [Draconibacterium sp.]|nr:hypothetical protein [Draconibacterium sp.]